MGNINRVREECNFRGDEAVDTTVKENAKSEKRKRRKMKAIQ